ncbi:MAG: hypothetical protein H6767_00615 [Candidatus Peribacteria bacterium]|nr:MAG: hypothetical protein H6767_00615 [Candidatus Peribacteria bacterium]
MQNRIDAKNRLLSLLHIEPNVAVTHEDVVLYPERAILYLPLQPLTEYKVSILPFLTDV